MPTRAIACCVVVETTERVICCGDQAKAVETYLKVANESLEAQNQAAEIKVRAERKAGELIGDGEGEDWTQS